MNNKDQTISFFLKEFDCNSLAKVKCFYNDNNEKMFEVGYDFTNCPVFIRTNRIKGFDEDYLSSVAIEEINFGDKYVYAIPFIQDYVLLQCDKISICNKGDMYVCHDNEQIKGLLIQNVELYSIGSLVDCQYQKRI